MNGTVYTDSVLYVYLVYRDNRMVRKDDNG